MDLSVLLNKKARIALVTTGGGAGIQSHLWSIPGISSVLVESAFPYASEATVDYLGFEPRRGLCSEETAVDLALEAYYRAYKFDGHPAVGVGLTASVASVQAHRGDHRAYAAYVTGTKCHVFKAILPKGTGQEQRLLDGRTCDTLAALAILEAVGELWCYPKFEPHAVLNFDLVAYSPERLMDRVLDHPFFSASRTRLEGLPLGQHGAMFPGTFNPPHEGHFGLVKSFSDSFGGRPVVFNIEVEPPHKNKLWAQEVIQRAKMLRGHDVLVTQGLGLYSDKAKAYPGLGFLIGSDALIQLLDSKWGPGLDDLVKGFQETKTIFYVADRKVGNVFLPLSHIDVPSGLYCRHLDGQWDVCSTDLRKPSNV